MWAFSQPIRNSFGLPCITFDFERKESLNEDEKKVKQTCSGYVVIILASAPVDYVNRPDSDRLWSAVQTLISGPVSVSDQPWSEHSHNVAGTRLPHRIFLWEFVSWSDPSFFFSVYAWVKFSAIHQVSKDVAKRGKFIPLSSAPEFCSFRSSLLNKFLFLIGILLILIRIIGNH